MAMSTDIHGPSCQRDRSNRYMLDIWATGKFGIGSQPEQVLGHFHDSIVYPRLLCMVIGD